MCRFFSRPISVTYRHRIVYVCAGPVKVDPCALSLRGPVFRGCGVETTSPPQGFALNALHIRILMSPCSMPFYCFIKRAISLT